MNVEDLNFIIREKSTEKVRVFKHEYLIVGFNKYNLRFVQFI